MSLEDIVEALGTQVAALDSAELSLDEARRLHDLFARAERLASAGRTLTAAEVDRTGAFLDAGHRSAASYIAARAGTTLSAAISTISTGRALPALPATRAAVVSGTLSASQAAAVTLGATADPSAEPLLLQAAATEAVADLRRTALSVRAAAPGGESRLEMIRATRWLRQWEDEDGAYRLDARLAPDDGARVRAVLEARMSELRLDGRRSGYPISPPHAGADALVDLTTGRSHVRTVVNVHVDAPALDRGHLEPGERCEIAGTGPIPVAAARRLMQDGWVKVIEHAGVDVRRVAHLGRMIPAHVRSAVDARYPKCGVTSCRNQRRLEYDHRIPVEAGGETSVANVWRLCKDRCHYLKTFHGWVPVQHDDDTWDLIPPARAP